MVGGTYGVIRVSFSCCRLEADVGGITPPVSSLTPQLHLQFIHTQYTCAQTHTKTHTHSQRGKRSFTVLSAIHKAKG